MTIQHLDLGSSMSWFMATGGGLHSPPSTTHNNTMNPRGMSAQQAAQQAFHQYQTAAAFQQYHTVDAFRQYQTAAAFQHYHAATGFQQYQSIPRHPKEPEPAAPPPSKSDDTPPEATPPVNSTTQQTCVCKDPLCNQIGKERWKLLYSAPLTVSKSVLKPTVERLGPRGQIKTKNRIQADHYPLEKRRYLWKGGSGDNPKFYDEMGVMVLPSMTIRERQRELSMLQAIHKNDPSMMDRIRDSVTGRNFTTVLTQSRLEEIYYAVTKEGEEKEKAQRDDTSSTVSSVEGRDAAPNLTESEMAVASFLAYGLQESVSRDSQEAPAVQDPRCNKDKPVPWRASKLTIAKHGPPSGRANVIKARKVLLWARSSPST